MTETHEKSHWLQDNLRILVSIGIVILLVLAIYSYSKRNAPSRVVVDDVQTTEDTTQVAMTPTDDVNKIITEIKDDTDQKSTALPEPTQTSAAPVAPVTQDAETTDAPPAASEPTVAQKTAPTEQDTAPARDETPSQSAHDVVKDIVATRNDDIITVTAVRGDSATTLARKAVTQYASARNITDISAAQKIYMEDYLRRTQSGIRVHPDATMTFTSAQIDAALTKARALTAAQLSNLDRYARTVSNL